MKSKIVLIIIYYGSYPNYFQLYLNSCANNPEIHWLIFTDNKEGYCFPSNVRVVEIGFDEIVQYIQSKLCFPVRILNAYKFCDFRPLYGELFSEYIKEYTHWGCCDMDLIWGRFTNFITDDLLENFDRILNGGHLTIYKNNKKVNAYYKLPYQGINYQVVLGAKEHFGFDESKGMSAICDQNSIVQWNQRIYADISFNFWNMKINGKINYPNQIFVYSKGCLYQKAENKQTEFLYIHLQKRKMNLEDSCLTSNDFVIQNDGFYCKKRIYTKKETMVFTLWHAITIIKKVIILKLKWNLKWRKYGYR